MARPAALLASALLLVGCAGPPQNAAPRTAVPPEPTATIQTVYGERLQSTGALDSSPERADMWVDLRDGLPSGNEPFKALDVLRRLYPGRREYWVLFRAPSSDSLFVWIPSDEKVHHSSGPVQLSPRGIASEVTTDAIERIAAADEPPPPFEQ